MCIQVIEKKVTKRASENALKDKKTDSFSFGYSEFSRISEYGANGVPSVSCLSTLYSILYTVFI